MKYAIPIKLTYNSTLQEIGASLMETLTLIDKVGETSELKFSMLLKYGRLLLCENKFDKALEVFQECGMHSIDNGIPNVKELYYWTSRCEEAKGDKINAINGYLMLLERPRFTDNDSEFVDAILDRLNLYGDISALINDYKIKRADELENPKDILGQVIKLLKKV